MFCSKSRPEIYDPPCKACAARGSDLQQQYFAASFCLCISILPSFLTASIISHFSVLSTTLSTTLVQLSLFPIRYTKKDIVNLCREIDKTSIVKEDT